MSAWGKYDDFSSPGTITIDGNGALTGSGTSFTELHTGDFIKTADGSSYILIQIFADDEGTVINADPELGDIVQQTGVNYTVSEKPTSIASDPNTLASEVFGVDRNEIHGDGNSGYISAVSIIQGGSGYTETPSVFVDGPAAATATITNGVVTAITVTNNGYGYNDSNVTVAIDVPRRTIPTANVNTSTETITYNNHGIAAGDAVIYYNNGGTTLAGLTQGATYYAGQVTANAFKLYNTSHRGATAIADQVIATSAVNTTANTITITGHGLVNGAQMNYNNQGGSSIGGLTSGNDYFVIVVDNNTIKLEDTVGGGAKDLTTTGNNSQTLASTGRLNLTGTGNNAQYFDLPGETTATAAVALGVNQGSTQAVGAVAHTGWVKRKVLAGQHAGRIQYEVLVAQSKNAGIVSDAADDIEFPED